MAITTTSSVQYDLQTYFAEQLLKVAEPNMVFRQFARMQPIPPNSSKTIQFVQYAKLGLVGVGSVLTEGSAPANTTVLNSAITAIADQYGAFVTLTDLAVLTTKHPVVQEATYLLGRQAGESIDQIIQATALAGTTVQYAAGAANRAALVAGNVVNSLEIRKAVKTLRAAAAIPYDVASLGAGSETGLGKGASGHYVCIIDPSVEQDLMTDTAFLTASQYSAVEKLYNNEVGYWLGCRFVRTNNMPAIASGTSVHTTLFLGQNAYAVSDLQSLQTYVQQPGGVSDPLEQIRTIGWKWAGKTVRLNETWMLRLESGSAYN